MSLQATSSPDTVSYVTQAAVFVGTVIATWFGVRKAARGGTSAEREDKVALAGGVLMDNTTMIMMTAEMKEMTRELVELRHMMGALKDEIRISNARRR